MEVPSLSGARLVRISAAILAVALISAALRGQTTTYEQALEYYKSNVERPPLGIRAGAWHILAGARDPRGLEQLVKDYARVDSPHEFARSALVISVATGCGTHAPPGFWKSWRTKNAKAEHCWLWFIGPYYEFESDKDVFWNIVGDSSLPVELRAATLIGAGDQRGVGCWSENMEARLLGFVQKPPPKGHERTLLLEAWSNFFQAHDKPLEAEHKAALRRLIPLMTDSATSERTRIVMSRHFAKALDREDVGPDPAIWEALMEDVPTPDAELAYARAKALAKPGFCGVVDHGKSIAFVVDASDSMLEPLTPRERTDLVPLTGGNSGGKAEAAQQEGAIVEQAIDWKKVQTRFDCARELLKLALRRLQPNQSFTVILFGHDAEYLKTTVGMVAANKRNIDDACKQLDEIAPGPATNDRPYGTLNGATNIHSGMLCAFRVAGARTSSPRAPTSRDFSKLDEKGIHTIYLFSDGAPTVDGFGATDSNESGIVQDAETGRKFQKSGKAWYPGPFMMARNLAPECVRLNMFQHATIHAIGLGEADVSLLKKIAGENGGKCILIGKD
ncbi:MAG: hypothetical protein ABL997_10695 [Planctomycetota bacterium]